MESSGLKVTPILSSLFFSSLLFRLNETKVQILDKKHKFAHTQTKKTHMSHGLHIQYTSSNPVHISQISGMATRHLLLDGLVVLLLSRTVSVFKSCSLVSVPVCFAAVHFISSSSGMRRGVRTGAVLNRNSYTTNIPSNQA